MPILNVHTPSSSLAIEHSLTEDSLQSLHDTLTRKVHYEYHGARVSTGWLKYKWAESVWNLDDDADYTIFSRRMASINSTDTPTIYLHDPQDPLPPPTSYRNPSYYAFQHTATGSSTPSPSSIKSRKASVRAKESDDKGDNGIMRYKKDFDRFHGENGVRTVIGSIGPVKNVRMLLKSGHRHVYMSRSFALKHHFIPPDAAPGHYGYGGIINIGAWPIILDTANTGDTEGPHNPHLPTDTKPTSTKPGSKGKSKGKGAATQTTIFLSEEPHFDVVLGRSFFEARQIHLDPLNPTDVWCGDTGEKLVCELVVLRDGKGDIVSVT